MKEEKIEKAREEAREIAGDAHLGGCVEANKELVRRLKEDHIDTEMMVMPKHNHVVTMIEGYVLDSLLTQNYGVGDGKVLFTREEHEELMKRVAKKEPFCLYMDDKDIVYEKFKEEED